MSHNNFVLGFAAVCTAGILLPLHWIIGIRLAREDEIIGLDTAGALFYSIIEIKDD
jgi:ammonia channel protein AmtB